MVDAAGRGHGVHQMMSGGWKWAVTRRLPHNSG